MAMTAGSVVIDQTDGDITKNGFAEAWFDLLLAKAEVQSAPYGGVGDFPLAERIKIYNALADEANRMATIVTYIQTNAVVSGSSVT